MNIAILGAGAIARTMATTLQPLKDVTCYAVAARDLIRAQVFADKFGFHRAYGSYSDMLEDPNVELVYIATPHSHHYEHIKMCLNHGKHVLCEKAFCANAKQAEEVLRMAEERGLLLTEAMWTRYMPMRKTINAVLKNGMIGKPTSLSCNLGYPLEHKERMMKLDLCGGALMDLGVYVLNFASMVFGNEISGLAANCIKLDSGVDGQETIMLSYQDGRMATLYCTMLAQTDRRGFIYGTNGFIEIENINNYESIRVYNLERKIIAQYAAPCQVTGYEYEVQSAMKAIYEGRIECPEMTHYDTLVIMQLLDSIREAWDLKFPYEVEKLDSDPELSPVKGSAGDKEIAMSDPNAQRIREAKERVVPVEKPTKAQNAFTAKTVNTEPSEDTKPKQQTKDSETALDKSEANGRNLQKKAIEPADKADSIKEVVSSDETAIEEEDSVKEKDSIKENISIIENDKQKESEDYKEISVADDEETFRVILDEKGYDSKEISAADDEESFRVIFDEKGYDSTRDERRRINDEESAGLRNEVSDDKYMSRLEGIVNNVQRDNASRSSRGIRTKIVGRNRFEDTDDWLDE